MEKALLQLDGGRLLLGADSLKQFNPMRFIPQMALMWINRGNLKISTPKLMDKQHRPKLSSTLITMPTSRGG